MASASSIRPDMARFNEILAGRYNNALKKLLSMKGPAPAPQLGGEIGPTLSMFYGVENRFLEEWSRFGLYLTITAGAATASLLRIRNPLASGAVAVVEKMVVANNTAAAQQYNIRHGNADTSDALVVNTAAVTQRWDSRGRPGTAMVVSSNSGQVASPPSPGVTKDITTLVINSAWAFINDENQEMLLLPGDAMDVFISGLAVTMDVAWTWRERALEESEKK
jgi:hypothetical protein